MLVSPLPTRSVLVFTLVMRITHNLETSEELTVDVFHDVWRRASTYTPDGGPVVGWIMNQARSRAIDRMRFEHRKKRVASPFAEPLNGSGEPSPHHAATAREEETLLRDALAELSQDERRAIETAFFSELTYVETASQLNEPVGTVKTRIRSGLAKLRRALAGKVVR
jgi:RNA polymerase sigma-70 factor, ECF subfamily